MTISKEAIEALKPFADAVFNDNGDITVDLAFAKSEDFIKAYFVHKRLSTLPIAGEGKVKELEWKQIELLSWWCADCYRIEDGSDRPFYLRQRGLSGALITLGCFDTIEAAKAAAQADFETRILSALISSPGKDGGQEVEPAEWQRFVDGFGWQRVNEEDAQHYRDKGVSLRALYTEPPTAAGAIRRAAEVISEAEKQGYVTYGEIKSRILSLSTQPASTALVERLTKALKQITDARCDHDMGFDREVGPLGCSLGDKCVCVGLCTIASRALQETSGLVVAPKADTTMADAVKNALGLLDTPVGRRRHEGDSFYSEVVASLRSALSASQSTSRKGER